MEAQDRGGQASRVRARLVISGRVQGVGFRGFALRNAQALGVSGWVRNLPCGSVEAVLEGERRSAMHYITLLSEGPPWARVDDVEIEWQDYRGDLTSFRVRG